MEIINEQPHVEIAQKRLRIISFILDYIALVIVAAFLFRLLQTGFAFLGIFLFILFNWPISEALFGRSIGKRILGLKVMNYDLNPASLGQTLIRFVLGVVDMPLCIGLIVAATDKENRRIGDRVANTIVVKKVYLQNTIVRKNEFKRY